MPTNAIHITVEPAYLPQQSAPEAGIYGFSYTITITNAGDAPAQLIARHWIISDASGHSEEVKGLGVVGHQPLLQPGQSFQYTSGCSLHAPQGTMHGTYLCVTDEGVPFECTIPLFTLDAGKESTPSISTPVDPNAPRVLH